jgi:hypothetical protein
MKLDNSRQFVTLVIRNWVMAIKNLMLKKLSSQSQSHIATDGQSVSKSWCRTPSDSHDQIFITIWQLRSCFVGRPLWREDGSVFYICCWPLPAQSFSDPSPLGLATIFYCLTFETSFFVVSYDSQGHGGGIWPGLHTGYNNSVRTSQETLNSTL